MMLPTLTLAFAQASTVLMVILILAVIVSTVLCLFPGIRRANALFAPVLVFLTLAGTVVLLGGLLYAVHHFDLL